MAEYIEFKTKKFKLKKEALDWTKKTKTAYKGGLQLKIETNFNANEPLPWQGVILQKI